MFSVKLQRKDYDVSQIISGPIGCSETSVRNYHYTLGNIPENCISQGDTINMVIIKFYSCLKSFSFQRGKCQAPYISMQTVSPLASHLHPVDGFTRHKNLMRLNVTSRPCHSAPTAITTWRTPKF